MRKTVYIFTTLQVLVCLFASFSLAADDQPSLNYHLRWMKQIAQFPGSFPEQPASPVWFEGKIYLATSTGDLTALLPKSGNRDFTLGDLPGPIETTPLIEGNMAYLGSDGGGVFAIDIKQKKIVWQYDVANEVISPLHSSGEYLLFTTNNDSVECLDKTTGRWLWRYTSGSTMSELTVRGTSGASTDDEGRVFVGFSNGYLIALQIDDGKELWKVKLAVKSEFHDVDTTPLIIGDLVIAASYDGSLYGIDRRSGEMIWQFARNSVHAITADENSVYYSALDKRVYCLNPSNGNVRWEFSVYKGTPNQVVVDDELLYVLSTGGYLHLLDKVTGEHVLSKKFMDATFSNLPLPTPHGIYAFSDGGWLYRLTKSKIYLDYFGE
jgi:outer membrane protein assembly factor BamB